MTALSLPTPFSPSDSALPRLLDAISNPALSLREIALAHDTTADALALWMARPEISDLLAATDSQVAWRTRRLAKTLLTKVVTTCAEALEDLRAARALLTPTPESPADTPAPAACPSSHPTSPIPHPTFPAALLKVRAAESTRRLCSLIFQLSRVGDTPRPTPRGVHATASATPTRSTPTTPPPSTASTSNDAAHSLLAALLASRSANAPAAQPTPSAPAPAAKPPTPTTRPSPPPTLPLPLPPLTSIASLLDPLPSFPQPSPTSLLAAAGTTREHWP